MLFDVRLLKQLVFGHIYERKTISAIKTRKRESRQ